MKIKERHKAIKLRKSGHSLKEIAKKFRCGKSSVSMWVRDVKLSPVAERRLLTKIKLGQFNAAKNKKAQTAAIENKYLQEAMAEIKKMDISENYAKIIMRCDILREGAKSNKKWY